MWWAIGHFDFFSDIASVQAHVCWSSCVKRAAHPRVELRIVTRLHATFVFELEYFALVCGLTSVTSDAVFVARRLGLSKVVIHIGYEKVLRLIGVPEIHLFFL